MSEIRRALQTERRQRFLKNLIEEAVINVLAEQDAMGAPPPPAPAPPPAAPDPNQAPPPDDQQQDAGEFTVDDMIERLNVIRGGRSFTDPEVYGQLVTYFKGLAADQKQALLNFLVELGKIVINVNDQDKPANKEAQQSQPPAPPSAPPAAQGSPAPPAGGGMPAPAI